MVLSTTMNIIITYKDYLIPRYKIRQIKSMTIIEDYFNLTKKYKSEYGDKTIILMEVGSFFEVYAVRNPDGTYAGSDIDIFARINEMYIADKHIYYESLPVVMAGVGTVYSDKYIQKTQEHGYTIVIYKQDSINKTVRTLYEIISPGTFFPVESQQLSNNVMCIWLNKTVSKRGMSNAPQVTIGISNIDIYTGKTSLFQFITNYSHNPATYDELERYISAYRPSECIFIANINVQLIDDIINFIGIENTKMHKINIDDIANKDIEKNIKNVEKQNYQIEVLKKFFPNYASFHEMFPTHYIAIQTFCYLLNFVYCHNPNLVKKLTEPVFENYTDRLILSNHALNQLNIIDDTRHTGKLRSISSLLNNCVTTMGKRHFLYKLHYPITNEKTLQKSYNITEYLINKGVEYNTHIRTQLKSISDLEKLMRKIISKKIMPKNLYSLIEELTTINNIYNAIQDDNEIMTYINSNDEINKNTIDNISSICKKIIDDIVNVFDIKKCYNLNEITSVSFNSNNIDSIINKGISLPIDKSTQTSIDERSKIEAICKYLTTIVKNVDKYNNKKGQTSNQTQYIKIHETNRNDPIIVGTNRRILLLKTEINKIIKKTPTVNLEFFSNYSEKTESFTFDITSLEYNNNGGSKSESAISSKQIRDIIHNMESSKNNLINETNILFQKYISEFIKYEGELEKVICYTIEMDMLQCKSYIASKFNYCKPTIYNIEETTNKEETNESFFDFTGIRHPLIEHLQTNELYVTNDMKLGNHKTIDKTGILLYGTNAVGKTSFIKSVGIAIILAQSGLFVPCETFIYKPYKNIFTRILGNDNLFKGLSTFAVEMTELRTILTMANENSLVLGDELCSGTESDSALSIFTAGLEILDKRKSTFLFATHFHEIVSYDEINDLHNLKMMHMAVHYNKEINALVYDRKLREGPGESMYGLEVCKSLHLPDDFLERAHNIRMKYNENSKNILSLEKSHFNSKKIIGKCEICSKKKASEVHHLQHQKSVNTTTDHIVNKNKQNFHKNHIANLINICNTCHNKIHKTKQEHIVVKTTNGYIIQEL